MCVVCVSKGIEAIVAECVDVVGAIHEDLEDRSLFV